MPNNVKSFTVGYNPTKKGNVFTSGDSITGQVTLELAKDCKVNSLDVKMKGKAVVKWSEPCGDSVEFYYDEEEFFTFKQVIIEGSQGNMVKKGCHVFPFSFQIPTIDLPSSFKRKKLGKIEYSLQATLSRPMRKDTKAKAVFTFMHKWNQNMVLSLMTPQQRTAEKKMNMMTSGKAGLEVHVDRTVFQPGDAIKVRAFIHNQSSRKIKPRFCLKRVMTFLDRGEDHEFSLKKYVVKEVGDAIPPSINQTVTKTLTIPPLKYESILHCSIIAVEYFLKVCLDVKYTKDLKVKFPIVILPAQEGPDEKRRV